MSRFNPWALYMFAKAERQDTKAPHIAYKEWEYAEPGPIVQLQIGPNSYAGNIAKRNSFLVNDLILPSTVYVAILQKDHSKQFSVQHAPSLWTSVSIDSS